ncbi:MAG: glycosyltransferase family 4 protein [Nitrospira sp.]|jgi:glycogen(starch) synthase|nr:glycosyltransferase family 4 protein [Nitrospira sp.]
MKKKLHILLLGPYPPPRGGVQTNMLAIKKELLRSGHQCSIISITRSEIVGPEDHVYHPRSPLALLTLLFSMRYDVLHLHIGGEIPLRVLLLIAACSMVARGKSVMTLHSGGFAIANSDKATAWTLQGFVFRRLTRIIVVNNLMVRMFKKFGVRDEKIRLIYPFVLERPKQSVSTPQRFQTFLARHDKILLTVGLLEPHYDLAMQIDVLEHVIRKAPNTGLIIIGSGSMEAELASVIAAKTYAQHILLAGDTEHDVVLHLIHKCDVLLRTTIFDGDAISIREALYLGTSVIATDTGMRPLGVHLIPIHDHTALENAIAQELTNVTVKKRNISSEDGWGNIREVVRLYEDLHLPPPG